MSQAIVSLIFRLFNFGVICALSAYAVKKKLIPQTEEKIAAKHLAVEELALENKQLAHQQKELEKEVNEQELLGQRLFNQIKIWSISFEQHLHDVQKEQEELALLSMRRAQEQAERKAYEEMRSAILKKALDDAAKQLIVYFASEKAGANFNASVVDSIRKEVS